jgi:hypothetical protein
MGYATSTQQIAADLRMLAAAMEALGSTAMTQTAVEFDLQICGHDGDEKSRTALAADLCKRLLNTEATYNGSNLYGTPTFGVKVGCISVDIFTGVRSVRELELAAEVEQLRAQLAANGSTDG